MFSLRTLRSMLFAAASAAICLAPTAQAWNLPVPTIGRNVPLLPTDGTTAFSLEYRWQGLKRDVVVIRPNTQTVAKAPAILMLHYDGGTPEMMGDLTGVGQLAATMGYWIILPAGVGGTWNDDPSSLGGPDDVGFLSMVVQSIEEQYPVDATRVALAGFSNGGFMSVRMACEAPELFSSVFAVGATMKQSLARSCQPSKPLPIVFVLGTDDPLVKYDGRSLSMMSAQDVYARWLAYNSCDEAQTVTATLPTLVNDGTSIVQAHNASCTSRGEVNLYTVNGGGHEWPDSLINTALIGLGKVTHNLNATQAVGVFSSVWTSQSTY